MTFQISIFGGIKYISIDLIFKIKVTTIKDSRTSNSFDVTLFFKLENWFKKKQKTTCFLASLRSFIHTLFTLYTHVKQHSFAQHNWQNGTKVVFKTYSFRKFFRLLRSYDRMTFFQSFLPSEKKNLIFFCSKLNMSNPFNSFDHGFAAYHIETMQKYL